MTLATSWVTASGVFASLTPAETGMLVVGGGLGLAAFIFGLVLLIKSRGLPEGELAVDDEGVISAAAGGETVAPKRSKRRGKRRVRSIVANVFLAACGLVLLLAVGVTLLAKKSGEPVSVFGFQPYVLASESMAPDYKKGGLVLARQGDIAEVEVGDVVAFRAAAMSNEPALHRVVEINGEGAERQLVVKGDNNQLADGAPVTAENYLGRAVWHSNLTAIFN